MKRCLAVFALMSSVFLTGAAPEETASDFPHLIAYELGEAKFAPGDEITIRELRGTSATITPGGTYRVEGTFTLNSREEATLAFFSTVPNSGPTPTDPRQTVRIKKGQGSFHLIKPLNEDGYLHLSFYPVPSGSSFGGVYFGQGDWVLRKSGFNFSQSHLGSNSPTSPSSLSGPNRVILEYLGDPVAPPANIETGYTKSGLINAIQLAAKNAEITLEKVEVDDSEYPFLLGVICKQESFAKLKEQIRKLKDYEYHGSVGSHNCYTLNIVPSRAFPAEAQQRISRRATVRMQIFFDQVSARE